MKKVAYYAALILLIPVVAHAQLLGGGGGGIFDQVLQWVQGNVVTSLGTLAIILIGIYFLGGALRLAFAVVCLIGIYIIFNPTQIINLIPHGG